MRVALRWIVLVVLLSAAGLAAGERVLSAFMLAVGLVAGIVLAVVLRFSQHE